MREVHERKKNLSGATRYVGSSRGYQHKLSESTLVLQVLVLSGNENLKNFHIDNTFQAVSTLDKVLLQIIFEPSFTLCSILQVESEAQGTLKWSLRTGAT